LNRRKLFFFLGSALLAAPAKRAAFACPVCIDALGGPGADAFGWSVLFLMAMPYLVVGSVGVWLYSAYRRRQSAARPRLQRVPNSEENER
jgi:hypothetical protein